MNHKVNGRMMVPPGAIAVYEEGGVLFLEFPRMIRWIGLSKESAIDLAKKLVEFYGKDGETPHGS
jgi:hypothetical protein